MLHDLDLPLTGEWFREHLGAVEEDFGEHSGLLVSWPQQGLTWIGVRWFRERVDIVIGAQDTDGTPYPDSWTMGCWLLHIKTRLQLLNLLTQLGRPS